MVQRTIDFRYLLLFTALALRVTERPLVSRLSRYITQRKVGVLKWLSLPVWLEIPLAVVLMDYTLCVIREQVNGENTSGYFSKGRKVREDQEEEKLTTKVNSIPVKPNH
ncbi:hypothetical protein [Candidatus Nitrospira neomarina]|uniref:Uncharacterized protein n=1 Tax=Candidatus Nitrospira neomarina TaxID=3020899 RepID=A0AA96GSA2_9BACT|nr:hypothetical protein [Candidatus Nitrospira neomarina]WNM62621.1 hypothetical protein PQG83_02425 [Candidatus Nitrospira neomarina]